MEDPDLNGGGLKENSFSALRASVWSKIKGGPWTLPLDLPDLYVSAIKSSVSKLSTRKLRVKAMDPTNF